MEIGVEVVVVQTAQDIEEGLRKGIENQCPVVFRGAAGSLCPQWADLKWEEWKRILCRHSSPHPVDVSYGNADSISEEGLFVKPWKCSMTFERFFWELETKTKGNMKVPVPYLQTQDDNLRKEFSYLLGGDEGLPSHIRVMTRILGGPPEACNLWIGDNRSVTSIHKDPYENFYCVLHGEKKFTIYPPESVYLMPYALYESGTYKPSSSNSSPPSAPLKDLSLEIEVDRGASRRIPWISHAPGDPSDLSEVDLRVSRLFPPRPVRLSAGDALYLPTCWFHRVTQSDRTLSVNYWYDAYDPSVVESASVSVCPPSAS